MRFTTCKVFSSTRPSFQGRPLLARPDGKADRGKQHGLHRLARLRCWGVGGGEPRRQRGSGCPTERTRLLGDEGAAALFQLSDAQERGAFRDIILVVMACPVAHACQLRSYGQGPYQLVCVPPRRSGGSAMSSQGDLPASSERYATDVRPGDATWTPGFPGTALVLGLFADA